MRFVQLQHLGQHLAYAPIWAYQEELLHQNLERKKQGIATLNTLLLLQHSPVYTLGKSGKASNILISEEERAGQGIEYFHINRGGDVTFHGPGQLVGYPILDLELFKPDLGWYLRTLEQCFIDVLRQYGIEAGRSKGETGVWIDADKPGKERKICAMGIRCSRWITMHGFAFNVNTNLHYFSQIVPCGIADKQVTSLANELGQPQDEALFTERFLVAFAQNFEVEFREEVSKFSAPENA